MPVQGAGSFFHGDPDRPLRSGDSIGKAQLLPPEVVGHSHAGSLEPMCHAGATAAGDQCRRFSLCRQFGQRQGRCSEWSRHGFPAAARKDRQHQHVIRRNLCRYFGEVQVRLCRQSHRPDRRTGFLPEPLCRILLPQITACDKNDFVGFHTRFLRLLKIRVFHRGD